MTSRREIEGKNGSWLNARAKLLQIVIKEMYLMENQNKKIGHLKHVYSLYNTAGILILEQPLYHLSRLR